MNEIKLLLLCGSRMAIPVMRDLVFFKQLAAVIIPQHCNEFEQEVRLLLKESAIPVLSVNKADQAAKLQQAIKKYQVNIGLMVTYTYRIPASVYEMPALGFFNLHPGPLPGYRGPDPVFWQIRNREAFASATLHKVDEDFDTGPIVLHEKIRLTETDTHGTLTTKLAELASRMVSVLLKLASLGLQIPSRPQDMARSGYFARQVAKDICIDWENMDALAIVALANACNPWNKGAVTKLNHKIIRFLEAEKTECQNASINKPRAGTIMEFEKRGILVATCDDSCLRVNYIYIDEGFFEATRLTGSGFKAGDRFINP